MFWIIMYVIFRPFAKKFFDKRKQLQTERRVARHTAIEHRRAHGGEKITFTPDELEYYKEHAVSPYDPRSNPRR